MLIRPFVVLCVVLIENVGCSESTVEEIRSILKDYDDRIQKLTANQITQARINDELNTKIHEILKENSQLKETVRVLEHEIKTMKQDKPFKDITKGSSLTSFLRPNATNGQKGNQTEEPMSNNVKTKNTLNTNTDGRHENLFSNSSSGERGEYIRDVKRKIKGISKRSERHGRLLVDPSNSYVAFTAKLGEHALNLGIHQPIVFDRVLTNIGGGYTADNGMFTAPQDGVYFFTTSIMCHSGDFIEVEIVHNGNHVVYAYASDATRFEQGTNGAVLSLVAGDHVWVRTVHENTNKAYGQDWSTFTGFLISY